MTLLTKPSHADTVDKVSHLSSFPSSSSWSQDLKDVRASCGDRCEVKGRAYLRCILEHGTSPQSIVRPRLWLGRDTQVFYLMFREARDEQWDKITVCAYLGYLELSAEIMGDSVLTQTLLNSFSQHVGKIQNNLHETSKYSLQSFASSIFNSFTSLQWDSWDWRVVTSQQQFLVFPAVLPCSTFVLCHLGFYNRLQWLQSCVLRTLHFTQKANCIWSHLGYLSLIQDLQEIPKRQSMTPSVRTDKLSSRSEWDQEWDRERLFTLSILDINGNGSWLVVVMKCTAVHLIQRFDIK